MGCDIHGPFIEYRAYEPVSPNGEVWYPVAEMDGIRDYLLFGLLAGVRGRAEPVIETTRGWPETRSYDARRHEGMDDCHSRSWASLDELRIVAEAYRNVDARHGDWSEADYMVALMTEVEARTGAPTRALYCFDN